MQKITIHNVWHVYRAKLVLFQGVEGELQLRALIFIQVFPALSQLVQRRQGLSLQQHSPWDGHLTVGGRGVCYRKRLISNPRSVLLPSSSNVIKCLPSFFK